MKLVKKDLNEIKAAEYNPRKKLKPGDTEFENIKKSIENFGYIEPIVLNDDDTIISGHQRRNVMLYLGYEEADCIVVSVGKAEEKALNIALNKITGEWDVNKLKDLIIDIKNLDLEVSLTGFNAEEINNIVGDLDLTDEIEVTEDDFDVDSVADAGKCEFGQIWKLGRHRLMCGDSIDIDDVDKLLNGSKPQIVFTDSPYNVGFNGRSGKFEIIENDNISDSEFDKFIGGVINTIKYLNPANYYIWCNWKFYGILQEKLPFKNCIVWAKNVFGMGKGYRHQHEFCLFNGMVDEDVKNESDLWEVKKDHKYSHPTQKPIELSARAFKNHKKAKEVVDLFGGSGSTLMSCEQLNRTCYMMEIDPHYCNVIIKRWEDYTGEKAVLLDE